MTAPEREALVKALLDEADDLRHAPSGDAKDEQHNYNWRDKPHRCLYDACRLVERAVAALSSPAVTVTEGWQPIETAPDDEPILVRYDNDEIHLIECDGDGYDWQPYDGKNQSAMGISKPTHWHRLPAFSTTPQTGSQE